MISSDVETSERGRAAGDDDYFSHRPDPSSKQNPSNGARNAGRNRRRDGPAEVRSHGQQPDDDDLTEQSPLLSPAGHEDDGFIDAQTVYEDREDEFQVTKSVWYLLLLTISIGGLQIAWSVELSNGSPFLLSLGLSKSLMALVWIAGPLSGTLVQPYVGMLSDKCRIPWGKRKPFMVGGAAATIVSLMFLAWTKEIIGGILGLFGADPESNGVKVSILVVAVVWVYVLDFAINTVQAAIRAFIVDCAPAHQQEAANAMASRIVGVGNIVGYMAGYISLPKYVGWLGNSQFQDLCAIASLALAATVGLSCLTIKERDPRLEGPPPKDKPGVLSFFAKIFTSIKRLPPQTKKVCIVQFCAWIGFFPMLFYTSSYIGEIYVEPFLEENPNMTPEELDQLYEKATRVGTFALLIFSITSLATNIFLPFFIAPTYDTQPLILEGPGEGHHDVASEEYVLEEKKSWIDYLVIPGFTLRRAWMLSQLLFTGAMFCTVFVRTVAAATALIGLVGITWALTLWAPWAIISAEISRRDALIRARRHQSYSPDRALREHDSSSGRDDDDDEYSEHDRDLDHKDEEEEADQAGVILGIHNMAIAAPQIIATFASSIIFKFFQKPRGVPGDHSIAIVLALGGTTVLVAAWFVHRIDDDATMPVDEMAILEEGDAEPDADLGPPSTHTRPSTAGSRRASTVGSRRVSHESLPRVSFERAALVRNSSFGGMEY